jgi:hypothetical protein
LTISERLSDTTIVATQGPDSQATVRLGRREFRITQRTEIDHDSVAGLCPLELLGVSLAA